MIRPTAGERLSSEPDAVSFRQYAVEPGRALVRLLNMPPTVLVHVENDLTDSSFDRAISVSRLYASSNSARPAT